MGAYGIENTKLCIKQAGMTIKWRAVTLEKYRNPEQTAHEKVVNPTDIFGIIWQIV